MVEMSQHKDFGSFNDSFVVFSERDYSNESQLNNIIHKNPLGKMENIVFHSDP